MMNENQETKSESEKFPALAEIVNLAELEEKKEEFIQLLFNNRAYSFKKNEGLDENASRVAVIAEKMVSFFFEKVSIPMTRKYGSMLIAEAEAGSKHEESKIWLDKVEEEQKIFEENFFKEIEAEVSKRFNEEFSIVEEK